MIGFPKVREVKEPAHFWTTQGLRAPTSTISAQWKIRCNLDSAGSHLHMRIQPIMNGWESAPGKLWLGMHKYCFCSPDGLHLPQRKENHGVIDCISRGKKITYTRTCAIQARVVQESFVSFLSLWDLRDS